MAFLVLLILQCGVRIAVLVPVGPLRLLLVLLNLCGVDQAIALRPFGRACVVLVIPDILKGCGQNGAWVPHVPLQAHLDVEIVEMTCFRISAN